MLVGFPGRDRIRPLAHREGVRGSTQDGSIGNFFRGAHVAKSLLLRLVNHFGCREFSAP